MYQMQALFVVFGKIRKNKKKIQKKEKAWYNN